MFLRRELDGRRLPYRRGEYSLTFDDGPTESISLAVARELSGRGIAATFFVLGERAGDEALAAIAGLGHRLGNHTYAHTNFDSFQGDLEERLEWEIGRCHARIEADAHGRIPFRAPGGAWSRPRLTAMANRLPFARRYIGRYGWDIDPCDWRMHRRVGHAEKLGLEAIRVRLEAALDARDRGIILLHDGFPSNEAHLDDGVENAALAVTHLALEAVGRRGGRFVPLKEPRWR